MLLWVFDLPSNLVFLCPSMAIHLSVFCTFFFYDRFDTHFTSISDDLRGIAHKDSSLFYFCIFLPALICLFISNDLLCLFLLCELEKGERDDHAKKE